MKYPILVSDLKTYINIIILTIILIFFGCNQNKNDTKKNENIIQFTDFEKLPQYPFLSIDFSLSPEQNKDILHTNLFTKNEQGYFERQSDSTTIIFEDEENLNTFKVYLKSQFYCTNNQFLFDYLIGKSTSFSGDKTFAEMKFSPIKNPFSLTYFTTENQIRIQFIKQ